MRKLSLAAGAFGCLMSGAVGYSTPAYAQFTSEAVVFTESDDNLTVQFSGDPTASILVTGSPEDWTVNLAGSGHTLYNGSGSPQTSVFTYSWIEPDNSGAYNNLTYNGDQTFAFISDSPTDAGGANATHPNGVSFSINPTFDSAPGAADDGDGVFFQVQDNGDAAVPEPASMALFATGVTGLGWIRRRRRR